MVEYLYTLDEGLIDHASSNHGHFPIHQAILGGNLPCFHFLLAKYMRRKREVIYLYAPKARTCLHLAVKHGRLEMVQILVERCGLKDETADREVTALYLAFKYGHPEIALYLWHLEAKCTNYSTLVTLLFKGAKPGHLQLLQQLPPHFYERCGDSLIFTIFHLGEDGEDETKLRLLLTRGEIDPSNQAGTGGVNIVHLAVSDGRNNFLRIVLETLATCPQLRRCHQISYFGNIPLTRAVLGNNMEACQLLTSHHWSYPEARISLVIPDVLETTLRKRVVFPTFLFLLQQPECRSSLTPKVADLHSRTLVQKAGEHPEFVELYQQKRLYLAAAGGVTKGEWSEDEVLQARSDIYRFGESLVVQLLANS